MSRRASHSPNMDAIEERVLSQAERAKRLREEVFAEGREREIRVALAYSTGTVVGQLKSGKGTGFNDELRRLRSKGEQHGLGTEPCFNCGTRRDVHREFGCKRWRGGL